MVPARRSRQRRTRELHMWADPALVASATHVVLGPRGREDLLRVRRRRQCRRAPLRRRRLRRRRERGVLHRRPPRGRLLRLDVPAARARQRGARADAPSRPRGAWVRVAASPSMAAAVVVAHLLRRARRRRRHARAGSSGAAAAAAVEREHGFRRGGHEAAVVRVIRVAQ
mgnify:CR=1 FL=1|jgi:hypothetical protein